MGVATSWYVYRETNQILSLFEQDEEGHEALERGRQGQPMSAWDGDNEERRAFLDEPPSAINGMHAHGRRSNSALWERERRSDDSAYKTDTHL
jgi:hypothetical protein